MRKQICALLVGLVAAGAPLGVAAEGREVPGFSSVDHQAQPALALAAEGVAPGFVSAGSGPAEGVLGLETRAPDDTPPESQAGASVQFRHGAFFFGGEAGYQASAEERFGAGDWDAGNVRVLLKVGVDL
ncbi:hypothetical protein SAMN05216429_1107 [Marinobacter persicus]|uniref:Uncharacterized protein n=1 Tax=Marinobacter persicus TaxID=930118 RepID=A0A1I3WKI2_9GAMM|nr:hypothetical protein [Marinobacter persicus]SFK07995.1 hypothetical protein SAMN05216429_1107 [Marinobacter persicus]